MVTPGPGLESWPVMEDPLVSLGRLHLLDGSERRPFAPREGGCALILGAAQESQPAELMLPQEVAS